MGKNILKNAKGKIVDNLNDFSNRFDSNASKQKIMDITSKGRNKIEDIDMEGFKELLRSTFSNVEKDHSISTDEKINFIIHSTSVVCAIIAIQPVPFADALILTPIQMLMITHLVNIIKKDYINGIVSDSFTAPEFPREIKASEILLILTSSLGAGVVAQQGIIGLYKTVIPFYGGITTIPLVYGATYAIGTVAKTIINQQINNEIVTRESIRKYYKDVLHKKEEELKGIKDKFKFVINEKNKFEEFSKKYREENNHLLLNYSGLELEFEKLKNKKKSAVKLLESNKEIMDNIYRIIDESEKELCISIFDMNDYEILKKVKQAADRGVKVRIITDERKLKEKCGDSNKKYNYSSGSYSQETTNRIKNCYLAANVTVKLYNNKSGGINHQKDILADGKVYISGSANFTNSGFTRNNETAHLFYDEEIIAQRMVLFETMYQKLSSLLGKDFFK